MKLFLFSSSIAFVLTALFACVHIDPKCIVAPPACAEAKAAEARRNDAGPGE